MEEKDIPELSEAEAGRSEAAKAALKGLADAAVEGRLDDESLAATRAQLGQIDLDMTRVLDSLHVPKDAGEYAEALTRILRRIPDGWGRWIGCGAGWYPLIVALDERLAEIAPDYELHQVKEKFGGLRYYFGAQDADEAIVASMDERVREAEQQASTTCEQCGAPGRISSRAGWYKTLCGSCSDGLGYVARTESSQ
jgi:hypothetical protein